MGILKTALPAGSLDGSVHGMKNKTLNVLSNVTEQTTSNNNSVTHDDVEVLSDYFVEVLCHCNNVHLQRFYVAQCLQYLQNMTTSLESHSSSMLNKDEYVHALDFTACVFSIVQSFFEKLDSKETFNMMNKSCGSFISLAIGELSLFCKVLQGQASALKLESILNFVKFCASSTRLHLEFRHVEQMWTALGNFHRNQSNRVSTNNYRGYDLPVKRKIESTILSKTMTTERVATAHNIHGQEQQRDVLFKFLLMLDTEVTDSKGEASLCPVNQKLLFHLFKERICSVNPQLLPMYGFRTFAHYLVKLCNRKVIRVFDSSPAATSTTEHTTSTTTNESIAHVSSRHFNGKEYLWRLILHASPEISQKAIYLMKQIFLKLSFHDAADEARDLVDKYLQKAISDVNQYLSSVLKPDRSKIDTTLHNIKGEVLIGRVLRLLSLVSLLASQTADPELRCHFSCSQGSFLKVTTVFFHMQPHSPLVFHSKNLHARQTLGDLKQQLIVSLVDQTDFKNRAISIHDLNLFLIYPAHVDASNRKDASTLSSTIKSHNSYVRKTHFQVSPANLDILARVTKLKIGRQSLLLTDNHLSLMQLGVHNEVRSSFTTIFADRDHMCILY